MAYYKRIYTEKYNSSTGSCRIYCFSCYNDSIHITLTSMSSLNTAARWQKLLDANILLIQNLCVV